MIQREAERTGKPTYPSYSSIPIEQASGPNAAQSEAEGRDRDVGKRRVRRQKSQRAHWLGNKARNHRSDDCCDSEEMLEIQSRVEN